jgi:outer membrane protein OmpA-like peptidoglycan-associated protein
MTSMLDAARSLLTPDVIARASTQTGESEGTISKGLGAIIPLLFATLAGRSDERGFMSQFATLATKVAGDPAAAKVDSASTWLGSLFGDGISSATKGVAHHAGITTSSASSLFAFATPLVLGFFGRMMRSDNLDAAGLASRLQSERKSLAGAVPHGLDSLLPGFTRPLDAARAATDDVAGRMPSTPATLPRRDRPAGSWVLPVILGALVLGGLLWWMGRSRTAEQARNTASDVAGAAVGTAGSAVDALTKRLPGNVTLKVPRGGMEDRLVEYLSAPASNAAAGGFDFDRIGFETGSASLTATSREQINNIAQILKAYPSARVAISGHTDNTGDPTANVELSRARAAAVGAALRDQDVASDRLDVQGYGSQRPLGDNSSEAGRARNRRVSLEVTRR